MHRVGFEPTIAVFERAKTVHVFDRAATVFGLAHLLKKICIVGGGSKVHSTLRPLNGLLCQPRVIMIMEKSVE
jgi:hypothetical protein